MILLELFWSYLKIGFFGFGGGYATLSLIQHEIVVKHQWITASELADIIAISQMTPGPIAINSGTYVGYTIAGFWGAVVATTSVCLPSLTLMILVTRSFLRLRGNIYVANAMKWMHPIVVAMIGASALTLIFPEDNNGTNFIDIWSWVLFGLALAATLTKKVSIVYIIILSAIAGIAIYYLPSLY